jgi:hypothetical protein
LISSVCKDHILEKKSMKFWRVQLAVLLALTLCLARGAQAQFSGAVSGIVTDSSGAVVPGASLKLQKTATAEQRTATSGADGFYQFVSLSPGNYELTTSMTGFKTSQISLVLQTNQTMSIPVALAVGSATESLSVSAQAALLATGDTRHGNTFFPSACRSQHDLAGDVGARRHRNGRYEQWQSWFWPR